jgi:hypothetical protein
MLIGLFIIYYTPSLSLLIILVVISLRLMALISPSLLSILLDLILVVYLPIFGLCPLYIYKPLFYSLLPIDSRDILF